MLNASSRVASRRTIADVTNLISSLTGFSRNERKKSDGDCRAASKFLTPCNTRSLKEIKRDTGRPSNFSLFLTERPHAQVYYSSGRYSATLKALPIFLASQHKTDRYAKTVFPTG